MREIKFRAWDEKRRIMHLEFNFIQSHGEGNNWILPIKHISDPCWIVDLQEHITSAPHLRQQFKLMQYTGLKDKNGREIYEGDILKAEIPAVVEWLDLRSMWCANNGEIRFELLKKGVYEVIGNIYENKELLDAKQT